MPPTTDMASRRKLMKLQVSGLDYMQQDTFMKKLGYQPAGNLCMTYKKEDGTRVLYIKTNEVQIVRVVGQRRELRCPSGEELLEVRHWIRQSDITIVPITFAWEMADEQPSPLINQESHIGVLCIKGARTYYYDSHFIQGAPINRHCEYQGWKLHLPTILENLNPLPGTKRENYLFRRDCSLNGGCAFVVLWVIHRITMEGPSRTADLGRWNPLQDEKWMDYSINHTAFLDFVHAVIRRVGGVHNPAYLKKICPRWRKMDEIPQYTDYDRRRGRTKSGR
ncbi:unnamed protein product [Orchesella dallaii]|uniref:Uncharacterized protein n=1 Tax=Orchesella dallaii TaxID=48710 RepID=A0ABP1RT68_9HEXA